MQERKSKMNMSSIHIDTSINSSTIIPTSPMASLHGLEYLQNSSSIRSMKQIQHPHDNMHMHMPTQDTDTDTDTRNAPASKGQANRNRNASHHPRTATTATTEHGNGNDIHAQPQPQSSELRNILLKMLAIERLLPPDFKNQLMAGMDVTAGQFMHNLSMHKHTEMQVRAIIRLFPNSLSYMTTTASTASDDDDDTDDDVNDESHAYGDTVSVHEEDQEEEEMDDDEEEGEDADADFDYETDCDSDEDNFEEEEEELPRPHISSMFRKEYDCLPIRSALKKSASIGFIPLLAEEGLRQSLLISQGKLQGGTVDRQHPQLRRQGHGHEQGHVMHAKNNKSNHHHHSKTEPPLAGIHARGGLLVPDTNGDTVLDLLARITHNEDVCLAILQRLRRNPLLLRREDIMDDPEENDLLHHDSSDGTTAGGGSASGTKKKSLRLLYWSCGPETRKRFEFFCNWNPHALKVLVHHVIKSNLDNERLDTFLNASLKHFPDELGLLLEKGVEDVDGEDQDMDHDNVHNMSKDTIYNQIFKFHQREYGEEYIWKIIKDCIDNATIKRNCERERQSAAAATRITQLHQPTNLYPFMNAAAGNHSDLNLTFHLLKRDPSVLLNSCLGDDESNDDDINIDNDIDSERITAGEDDADIVNGNNKKRKDHSHSSSQVAVDKTRKLKIRRKLNW